MCDCNSRFPGLHVVFEDLYRKTKPCVCIKDETLLKALWLAREHCLTLDGCCSSRVFVSTKRFAEILYHPADEKEKLIQDYFQCPEIRGCCDAPCAAHDSGFDCDCSDEDCL